jgi:ribosomal protein S12 methylthiotransferase
MKINIISLGCPKNLVDTEILCGLLNEKKHNFVVSPQEADVIILSTCSFISSARKEAKNYINKLVKLKKEKNFKLIVVGCLPELEKENLQKTYPEVDAFFGISEYKKIPKILKNLEQKIFDVSEKKDFIPSCTLPRVVSTKNYAYLKIADGCNNRCSYCLIPNIRGQYRERSIEDILEEANKLVSYGKKELIIISQDTTLYGTKIYKKQILHKLLTQLSKIKDLFWIRILYTHPAHFYDELIKEISSNEKVCKYIDLPIQHTSDKILSLMNRKITRKEILNLIEKLKKHNITLRTTIMVGFPEETEKDFKILYNDIKTIEFDWLGVFKFEKQRETSAYNFKNEVLKKEKDERFKKIMELQQKITYKKNLERLNKIYPMILDDTNFGHTEFQCPEIDGKTYISQPICSQIISVKPKKLFNPYDLFAEVVK